MQEDLLLLFVRELHLSHKKVGRDFVQLLRKCIGSLSVGVYDLVCSRSKAKWEGGRLYFADLMLGFSVKSSTR
jgi:hypothetical protein